MKLAYLLLIGLLFGVGHVRGQVIPGPIPTNSVTVAEVVLRGHKRTRDRIIYREMSLGVGDELTAADFIGRVDESYHTLMNTGLFTSVAISYSDTLRAPGQQVVTLDILEAWYIYPAPEFTLADRNFNVWWRDEGRSLDRVNLGAQLSYYNFTGQRDRLRLGVTTGYTHEYKAGYLRPYLNRAGTVGMEVNYNYLRRREQNYATANDDQLFYHDDDGFVYRNEEITLSASYRRHLYVKHRLIFGYRSARVADTIAQVLNPDFFGEGRSHQRFFRLQYSYSNDHRDRRNYPWEGYYISANLAKEGLGILGKRSGLTFSGAIQRFIPVAPKLSLNVGVAGKYSLLRRLQPFLDNRAIGFDNNDLIGYQFYVVDGLDMLIWRAGARRELFKLDVNLGKLMFIEAFRHIPTRTLLAFQFNQGFSNSPYADGVNPLANRLLTGASFGIDVVMFYDMVAGVQYSRNHLGEGGVLLALQLNF